MEYNHLMADANTAFGGGQYHIALENAKKAMSIEPKKTDSYYCAGKACMAMGRADDELLPVLIPHTHKLRTLRSVRK